MTSSQTERHIPLAAVVDAVNALPDPAARAAMIAALRERHPEEAWLTKRGLLSVPYDVPEDSEE